ncbi:MAG: HesA/MoeB/ThiF family protein [Chloroflexota bacterium]
MDDPGKWVLHVRLTIEAESKFVPASSEWFVLVDQDYPQGRITFYPAKQSLCATFQHQIYNAPGRDDRPWRPGNLCLTTTLNGMMRGVARQEPMDMHSRLHWHFERAMDWLRLAALGELVRPGDPFELPHFHVVPDSRLVIVFSEDPESYSVWSSTPDMAGIVHLFPLPGKIEGYFVKSMLTIQGKDLYTPSWGQHMLGSTDGLHTSIWIRLDDVPVLPPWQAPATWGELRDACRSKGIDLNNRLRAGLAKIRDGKPHLALLGFPIPFRIGESPKQLHWQALFLPTVSCGTKTADGFRSKEPGYWQRDITEVLGSSVRIAWLESQNWHSEQISARGRAPKPVRDKTVLVIGAGALGSVVAELLVRTGVHKAVIIDGDVLEIGNLVRHPLGMDDIQSSKAKGVARRLSRASPHATVTSIDSPFPPADNDARLLIEQCDVILDATASEELPLKLCQYPWPGSKLFISISLGYQARRLFCFASYGITFAYSDFVESLTPWLEAEARDYSDDDFPWEGVGCWHPVFPARVDDIWMLASVATKHLIELMAQDLPVQSHLTVFEQQMDNGTFVGVRMMMSAERNE